MNKWFLVFFLGLVAIALVESSLHGDRKRLVNALKARFKELKLKTKTDDHGNDVFPAYEDKPTPPNPPKKKYAHEQHLHDKAASAIGLALLDMHKPEKHKAEFTHEKKKEDAKKVKEPDEDASDEDYMSDEDDITSDNKSASKDKHQKPTEKDKKHEKKRKMNKKKEKVVLEDDENEKLSNEEKSGSEDSSDKPDIEEDETDVKTSDKKLKNSVKSLKNSVKRLKDKDLKSVNVGDLKKLLANSVENLDKAEKAIHDILQYDEKKKSGSKSNNQTPRPQPVQGYPQSYGGYQQQQQPSSAYQTTCPGQCSNLCAPACRDPCCRFPPNLGMSQFNAPAVQARGSYQQGLINAYPPMTQLGGAQSSQIYMPQQGQAFGQQCGSQCSAQSCAPSCNPSCCSSGAQNGMQMPQMQGMPPPQTNAGCPTSCLNNCAMGCPRSCCVPGRK